MKQRLITHTDINQWRSNVNEYLENGWTVLPGSLQVTTAICRDDGRTDVVSICAVIVQTDEEV